MKSRTVNKSISVLMAAAALLSLFTACGNTDSAELQVKDNTAIYSPLSLVSDTELAGISSIAAQDDLVYLLYRGEAESYITSVSEIDGSALRLGFEGGDITSLFAGSDGYLYFSEVIEASSEDDFDKTCAVHKLDADGDEVYSQVISPPQSEAETNMSISRIAADSEGRAYIHWNTTDSNFSNPQTVPTRQHVLSAVACQSCVSVQAVQWNHGQGRCVRLKCGAWAEWFSWLCW